MALVIRSWYVGEKADSEANFVSVSGREAGLISWVLTVFGIDATTKFRVTQTSVYLEQGSLEGYHQRLIPLSRVSSAYFGYKKPWKEAIALALVLSALFGGVLVQSIGPIGVLIGIAVGVIIGILYYALNKVTSIGIVEVGGIVSGIDFKRSVIEGQDISEKQGRVLVNVVRQLIENTTT